LQTLLIVNLQSSIVNPQWEVQLAKEIVMPALGMAQETGVLLQWLKQPGEAVTKGEPLMEVETDKAAVEVEAPISGILANVTAGPGDVVPVGQVIALILAPGESAGEQRGRGAEEKKLPPVVSATLAAISASPVATRMAAEHKLDLNLVKPEGGRIQKGDVLAYLNQKDEAGTPVRGQVMKDEIFPPSALSLQPSSKPLASPKAKRLAKENGLELAAITGSGPDGAILAADVIHQVQIQQQSESSTLHPSTPLPPQPSIPMSRTWRIAAERLTQSWTTIPHFYLMREVNTTALTAWREKVIARKTEKITYTDLLVKIVATALRCHPRLNAAWSEGAIILNQEVNIGLAVAIEEGLVVPVIQQADTLGLNDLAIRRKELVAKAQAGKLALADISQGTFTISNLGMYGVDAFNAIINPPQAAILAVSRIADRVAPVNGQPAVQPMMTLTLSCDHRVVDGARGAQFLQTLAELVEEPLRLLD
jgi:pyruvate dehydrogenase E2 component (dihydrolipoamide acetyltransferase)